MTARLRLLGLLVLSLTLLPRGSAQGGGTPAAPPVLPAPPASSSPPAGPTPSAGPGPQALPSLPALGPWLERKDGTPAHWLGLRYEGRILLEPVNVVIVDAFSVSDRTAVEKLMAECKRKGYEEEYGHSSGYYAAIGDAVYGQIPDNRRMAFSDKDFLQSNNHGRIMGPARFEGKWVFVGAFSREALRLQKGLHHGFLSFTRARDDFSAKLAGGSVYRIAGRLALGNVVHDETFSTADHDGEVLVLEATR